MTLTPAALEEYRALLGEVNRLAQGDFVALWRSLEHLDKERMWDALRAGVPEIVELYRATAADTATLFYTETQGLSFDLSEVNKAARVPRDQLEASMKWALFSDKVVEPMALIAGMVQKHVVDGSRDYGLAGFENAGKGWYRAARPGACEFCQMLATRAATEWGPYSSAKAAVTVGYGKDFSPEWSKQVKGSTFHDHCMCIPVKAEEYEVPDYVDSWKDKYDAAVGTVGNDFNYRAILSEMRKLG